MEIIIQHCFFLYFNSVRHFEFCSNSWLIVYTLFLFLLKMYHLYGDVAIAGDLSLSQDKTNSWLIVNLCNLLLEFNWFILGPYHCWWKFSVIFLYFRLIIDSKAYHCQENKNNSLSIILGSFHSTVTLYQDLSKNLLWRIQTVDLEGNLRSLDSSLEINSIWKIRTSWR